MDVRERHVPGMPMVANQIAISVGYVICPGGCRDLPRPTAILIKPLNYLVLMRNVDQKSPRALGLDRPSIVQEKDVSLARMIPSANVDVCVQDSRGRPLD